MVQLNTFALSGLLITVAYLPLFFFLFMKRQSGLVTVYSLHILAIIFWGIGAFGVATTLDPNIAIIRWKFAYINVLLIPVFFYHTVYILTQKKNLTLLLIIYGQVSIFIMFILTDQMILSLRYVFNEFYVFNNSVYYILSFLAWELIVLLAHIDLIKFLRKQEQTKKEALIALIFAGIGFIGGTNNFLTGLNIDIYPYGNFLIPLHSFGVTYGILKHKLFDIQVTLKKSIIYSILFTTITLIYLIAVITIEKIIQYCFGYTSPIISIVIAFLIGILFIPIRNIIQTVLDRYFFTSSHVETITENEKLLKELEQTEKLRSIALFASGMAHEIKNPLTSIKTLCTYLPQKLHDKDFIEKFIPLVNKDVDRINELVHDLLDYAKPSPPDKQATDIHKLIEAILNSLNSQIVPKKIRIDLEFDLKNIPTIELDPKQIKQALLNIFLNAIESMQLEGILRVSTTLSHDHTELIIQISDTGCGIDKQDLPHIFDPFFTKKEQGTGLGLSITHGIVKEHGGKIFAESQAEKGTTFRIELPLRKQL